LFTVQEILGATGGELRAGNRWLTVEGVAIDSRDVKKGDLFVAIPGSRVDGHDFVSEAFGRGARAALVSRWPVGTVGEGEEAVIQVENTVSALGDLARVQRDRYDIHVVGVTGSVGKTTTKEMVAGVLARRYRTLKTEGNYNTEIGLPLTLFRLKPEHEAAVLEMAMRGKGQIRVLCGIARPTLGVITRIGETHLELLKTRDNIAAAKAELLESLPVHGVAVLNGDDPMVRKVAGRAPGRVIFYGTDLRAEVRAKEIQVREDGSSTFTLITPGGDARVVLPVPGHHNVLNALAAAGVGIALGIPVQDIVEGLAGFASAGMRTEIVRQDGLVIINDTYNASPTSTRAALHTLSLMGRTRRKVAVLGDMLELGSYTEEGHRLVGETVVRSGVDLLVVVGELGAIIGERARAVGLPDDKVVFCAHTEEAVRVVPVLVKDRDVVLVKGSRGMRMERVVQALRGRQKPSTPNPGG